MEERKNLFLISWTVGLFFGLLSWALRLLRIVEISGYDIRKLIPLDGGLLLMHRHPSLREPILLPLLFFP